ncbi:unnamed protein product, partial [Nesidiocoris tenuis]
MSRSNSMTNCGQCRLAPLIPMIQDSNQLYDCCVKLMFKLHASLPPDLLSGHRARFLDQFNKLRSFYISASILQYFKTLIQIPSLPEKADVDKQLTNLKSLEADANEKAKLQELALELATLQASADAATEQNQGKYSNNRKTWFAMPYTRWTTLLFHRPPVLSEMLSHSRKADTGVKLEVNEKILDSCTGLMHAIRILVQKSRILQAEIVAQGKDSIVYKKPNTGKLSEPGKGSRTPFDFTGEKLVKHILNGIFSNLRPAEDKIQNGAVLSINQIIQSRQNHGCNLSGWGEDKTRMPRFGAVALAGRLRRRYRRMGVAVALDFERCHFQGAHSKSVNVHGWGWISWNGRVGFRVNFDSLRKGGGARLAQLRLSSKGRLQDTSILAKRSCDENDGNSMINENYQHDAQFSRIDYSFGLIRFPWLLRSFHQSPTLQIPAVISWIVSRHPMNMRTFSHASNSPLITLKWLGGMVQFLPTAVGDTQNRTILGGGNVSVSCPRTARIRASGRTNFKAWRRAKQNRELFGLTGPAVTEPTAFPPGDIDVSIKITER